MFKKKTVFVVDAGGSFEVGLPVGDGLAIDITSRLRPPTSATTRPADEKIADAIHTLSSHNEEDVVAWFQAASSIALSMPLALSIDNYLHTHSDNSRIVQIGKLAIARCILAAEAKSELFVRGGTIINFHNLHSKYRMLKKSPSWHNLLFKMLTENVKGNNLSHIFKDVCIITFNYDRCIEQYLTHAFAQFIGMPINQARDLVSGLEIIHPYGVVGDYFGSYRTEFGSDLDHLRLVEVVNKIRTFTEQITDDDMMDVLNERLTEAHNVVFLGFSFGDMNIKLLQASGERVKKNIVGSALNISPSNLSLIEAEVRKALKLEAPHHLPLHLKATTCSGILSDYSRLLLS